MFLNQIQSLKNNESGATAIEYGLIAALIAVAIISAVAGTGTNLGTLYNDNIDDVTTAIDAANGG